jgi:hypothetical protein
LSIVPPPGRPCLRQSFLRANLLIQAGFGRRPPSSGYYQPRIKTQFEPLTRRNDGKRRLLVIDGHSSHLTTRFLRFCITRDIDLALLPPHTSHITQPLDIACFGPLKIAINIEIDRIFRHSTRRLQRAGWTQAYIIARTRCFKPSHVESAFKHSGIYPLEPKIDLNTLHPPKTNPPFQDEIIPSLEEVSDFLVNRSRLTTPPALPIRQLAE